MKEGEKNTNPLERNKKQSYLLKIKVNKMVEPITAIAAAIGVGICAVAAGYAEAKIGVAAVGAMSENEKFFGKGLIMTVLPETIVIFGLIVSIMILNAH